MKYGIREICDVVLKAKSKQKIGNKVFYKDEPVCYFDSLKTSSLEGAATTVYAQGGRGNSRLVAWEGERTVTFTMEDALISTEGLALLTGAGIIEPTKAKQTTQIVTQNIQHEAMTQTAWSYLQDYEPSGYTVPYPMPITTNEILVTNLDFFDPTMSEGDITEISFPEGMRLSEGCLVGLYSLDTSLGVTTIDKLLETYPLEQFLESITLKSGTEEPYSTYQVNPSNDESVVIGECTFKFDTYNEHIVHIYENWNGEDYVDSSQIQSEVTYFGPSQGNTVWAIVPGTLHVEWDEERTIIKTTPASTIPVHVTEVTDKIEKTATSITITPSKNLSAEPNAGIYIMPLLNGNVFTEPYIGKAVEGKIVISSDNNYKADLTPFEKSDSVLLDYYTDKDSGVQQIEITPDKFGGNYYLEASTLFRDTNGVDMPAEFIIPNCKIQSNFTFSMASSGDPSTFTFTMDAFPDYTRFDKTKKVLSVIQVITDSDDDKDKVRKSTDDSLSRA